MINLLSEYYSNCLSGISDRYDNVHLCGDLNLDVLKFNDNKYVHEYIDLTFAHGFLQIITKPTRVQKHSATLIDHILTNNLSNNCKTYILCTSISDHFPIFYSITNANKPPPTSHNFTTRNFTSANINRFKDTLTNITWNDVLTSNDPQIAHDTFSETFYDLFNQHFPLKNSKLKKRYHKVEPWMTTGILTSRKTKQSLNLAFIKKPTISSKEKFTNFRNTYNSVIRSAKKLYYNSKLAEYKDNLQKTWDTLFLIIRKGKKKKSSTSPIFHDGKLTTDPTAKANLFNCFFTDVANRLTQSINPSNTSPTQHIAYNEHSFSFTSVPLTENEILESTLSLKSKYTPDFNGISSSFLKKIITFIVTPIHHIFNLSLTKGIVPTQLKIAKVVPIFKSDDPQNLDNYRPISLLNTFSKVLEKIVNNRLYNFFHKNNLLSPFQFGFRPKHSTVHPMMHLVKHVSEALNNKKYTIAIFCDLRKAFDSCNHGVLLDKLKKYGVRNTELDWFRSYLTDRKQFVSVGGGGERAERHSFRCTTRVYSWTPTFPYLYQ